MTVVATSEQGGPWFPPEQWLNTSTNQWQPGTRFFPIRDHGYYETRVEYWWYKDTEVSGGYDVLDSVNHYVNAGWSVSAEPWCTY